MEAAWFHSGEILPSHISDDAGDKASDSFASLTAATEASAAFSVLFMRKSQASGLTSLELLPGLDTVCLATERER